VGVAIHDISVPIRADMPIYAGDPDVDLERASSIAEGGHANVSKVSMGVHTGTHVDAPVHFLEGAPGMESVSLDALCGPAVVVDGTGIAGDSIGQADLEPLDIPDGAERVILKTTNSELWNREGFTRDFLRLDGSGARYIVSRGIRTTSPAESGARLVVVCGRHGLPALVALQETSDCQPTSTSDIVLSTQPPRRV